MRAFSLFCAGWLCLFGLSGCTLGSSHSTSSEAAPSEAPSASASQDAPASRQATPTTSTGKDARSVADRLQDASVETRIRQQLVRREALRLFDFTPESVNGRVLLRGDVNTASQRRLAARIARSVEGVAALDNQVTVQGQSPAALAEANKTADKAGNDGSTPSSAVYHTVESGDSLWKIAREYQASVDQLRELNDLNAGGLQPGERIRVR